MDEPPRQLIPETRVPEHVKPGGPERHDYQYERRGVVNVFVAVEPLADKRRTSVTEQKTKRDWTIFIQEIAAAYPTPNASPSSWTT